MIQQGIEGADGRFLRADGTIPLSGYWNSSGNDTYFNSTAVARGGILVLGELRNNLRISRVGAEIIQIVGISNNLAELNQKNATMEDLAGVGVRAVLADVNGKLSAP